MTSNLRSPSDGGRRSVGVLPNSIGLNRELTYLWPEGFENSPGLGDLIEVPLGARRIFGWVVGQGVPSFSGPMREVKRIVGAGPPPSVLDTCYRAGEYFASSPLHFLKAATGTKRRRVLPSGVSWNPQFPLGGEPLNSEDGELGAVDGLESLLGKRQLEVIIWCPPATSPLEWVVGVAEVSSRAQLGLVVVVPNLARRAEVVSELSRQGLAPLLYPEAWSEIAALRAPLVVGARSAILAPVEHLGAVLVVDPSDPSMREQSQPTWEAWRLASIRAKASGARALFVSAAPPLGALGKGGVLIPPGRSYTSKWPELLVVELGSLDPVDRELARVKGYYEEAKKTHDLTDDSLPSSRPCSKEAIHGTLVLIHNRRGYISTLWCKSCGSRQSCEFCDKPLLALPPAPLQSSQVRFLRAGEARRPKGMHCVSCKADFPFVCACGSSNLHGTDRGVDALAEELKSRLGVEVLGVSSDSASFPKAGFEVAVGTEALLYRPLCAQMVVFLDFDQFMAYGDLSGMEKSVYAYSRAADSVRARRGKVVLQVHSKESSIVQALLSRQLPKLYREEMKKRREFLLPPALDAAIIEGPGCKELLDAHGHGWFSDGVDIFPRTDGGLTLLSKSRQHLTKTIAELPRTKKKVRVSLDPRDL